MWDGVCRSCDVAGDGGCAWSPAIGKVTPLAAAGGDVDWSAGRGSQGEGGEPGMGGSAAAGWV